MTDAGDVLGKWIYGTSPPVPYGEETSYRKAIDFLDGPHIVEDWGCGLAWARRFVKRGRYIGVDGSWSLHADLITDLRLYRSRADAILMRHVIEHNWEWRKVLENALASFQKRFALVLFTPFSGETHSIGSSWGCIPDLSFRKDDLIEMLRPFPFTEESLRTQTQYGIEHLFYISRQP